MNTSFKYEYTDLGNAKRWKDLHSNDYKFIYETKEWYRWTGKYWKLDHEKSHLLTIESVIESIRAEISECDAIINSLSKKIKGVNIEELKKQGMKLNKIQEEFLFAKLIRKSAAKWSTTIQNGNRIKTMLDLAQGQTGVSRSISEFDTKGHYLGVGNGVVDLRNKELITNDSEYLIMKYCSCNYIPEATCPNWDLFLEKIFQNDKDTILFMQRLVGQAISGEVGKSNLILFNGVGANGKSVFVDTIDELMGQYSMALSSKSIMNKGDKKEYYLASLKGIRLSIMNESGDGDSLDESTVKSLIGSGMIQARVPAGQPFTFQPVSTMILVTNILPQYSGEYATARRILVVPFNYKIPTKDQVPNYRTETLRPEMSGILNWAIEGYRMYKEQGLRPPISILAASEDYRKRNNRVEAFVDECCLENIRKKTKLTDVVFSYENWSLKHGFKSLGSHRLADRLRILGFIITRGTNGVFWVDGLALKSQSTSTPQEEDPSIGFDD